MPVLLAHGALGPFDEILFIGVAVIFLVMMGISWVRSRNTEPSTEDERGDGVPAAPAEPERPDHFPLE